MNFNTSKCCVASPQFLSQHRSAVAIFTMHRSAYYLRTQSPRAQLLRAQLLRAKLLRAQLLRAHRITYSYSVVTLLAADCSILLSPSCSFLQRCSSSSLRVSSHHSAIISSSRSLALATHFIHRVAYFADGHHSTLAVKSSPHLHSQLQACCRQTHK